MSEFKQGVAITNFPIGRLVNKTSGDEIITGTVTGTYLLDGSAGALSGSVSYDDTAKMWVLDNLADTEVDGLVGGYSFSHDDAVGGGVWIGIKTVLRLVSEINLVAGQIVAVNDPGNNLPDDVSLEVMRQAAKNFPLTINDASGTAIDMSAKNLRFVVETRSKTPVQVFKKESFTISGDDNEIVTVATVSADNTQTEVEYNWRLWDQDDDTLYAHGPYTIAPSSDNV